MPRIRLTKEFHFEMAHVLEGYDGPCRHVHGHSYRLRVTVIGSPMDNPSHPKHGMVMDYKDLKAIVHRLVVEPFDHALMVHRGSALAAQPHLPGLHAVDFQPTCENLLAHIAQLLGPALPAQVRLHSLTLHETSSSYAQWFASDNP